MNNPLSETPSSSLQKDPEVRITKLTVLLPNTSCFPDADAQMDELVIFVEDDSQKQDETQYGHSKPDVEPQKEQ